MIKYHTLADSNIDLANAIARHSSDKIIIYKKVGDEEIRLGYYFPKPFNSDIKHPVFLLIHGGGWTSHKIFASQSGWQGDYLGYLARYYADRGFVCVSIDYRLSRENGQIPGYEIIDCYEDCCDAVDYVMDHAAEYGIDLEHMYLLGESAGGHLAGAVAAFHYDRRYMFNKVILVNAITHFSDHWKSRVPINSSHPNLISLTMEERARFIAPLYQIDEFTSEVILIHGSKDLTVNPRHSIAFYERMRWCSRPCELHLIMNATHGFLLAEYYKNGLEACKIAISIINNAVI